jgi:hypothetical protein
MKNYRPGEGTMARKALEAITLAGQMTPLQLATELGTSPKNIAAILYACIDHKLVVKIGRGAGTYYRLATGADQVADISHISQGFTDEPVEEDGGLTISIWSDGDVMVEGATVHTDDGNKVVFNQRQIQQLVRMVARPVVAL